jgi:hypothetical protein
MYLYIKNISLLYGVLLSSMLANAEAIYPALRPLRPNGIFQGSSPSCQAEAEVNAIENYLSRNQIQVRISRMHYFHWIKNHQEQSQIQMQYRRDTASDEWVNRFGPIVPEIISPEDEEGFVSEPGIVRPNALQQALYFVPPEAQNYLGSHFFRTPAILRSTNAIDELKNWIRSRKIFTLSVDADDFGVGSYDFGTGLPTNLDVNSPRSHLNHALAVVGFDDELQGFIVLNSWSSNETVQSVRLAKTSDDAFTRRQFQRFRGKFGDQFNVQAFLVPYSYIGALYKKLNYLSLIQIELDPLSLVPLDRIYTKYIDTAFAVFTCSKKQWIDFVSLVKSEFSKGTNQQATIRNLFANTIEPRYIGKKIYFAKIPVLKSGMSFEGYINRLDVFYERTVTNYSRYYCPNSPTAMNLYLNDHLPDSVRQRFYQILVNLGKSPRSEFYWGQLLIFINEEL